MRHPWKLLSLLVLPVLSLGLPGARPRVEAPPRPPIFARRPLPRWEGRDPTLSPRELRLLAARNKDLELVLKLEAVIRVDPRAKGALLEGVPLAVESRDGRLVLRRP